jgi:cysteine synthase B
VIARSRAIERITDAVGDTPMVRLRSIQKAECPDVALYLKLEYQNPGGSVKDRPALRMIQEALKSGALTKDKILVDSTSGNTGVAYSIFGAALGVRVMLVMPSNVSQARKDITQAFGTELVYSDPMEGSDGAIRLVREMVAREPDRFFYPDQYSNANNPLAHYHGTGREILEQVGDRITHFVAGLGTTGTAMGTSRRLHEAARKIHCVAAEPSDAMHGLEGLKHLPSSLVPAIFDESAIDERMPVGTEEGWDMAERVLNEEGLHVGHSTGANVWAAVQIGKRIGRGCVVTIACDRGDRYFEPLKWEKPRS